MKPSDDSDSLIDLDIIIDDSDSKLERPQRISNTCLECNEPSMANAFENTINDHKHITIGVCLGILTIVCTLFIILLMQNPRNAWELVNMIITIIFASFVLLYGKFNVNKKLAYMVFILNFAYMIVFYMITNFVFISFVSWVEYYKYFDQIAHFNMGWMLYHAFRTLFNQKNMVLSILFGVLFELVYEMIEYSYGCTFGMWCITQVNEMINFGQDVVANIFGSTFGFLIEYLFFRPYTKNIK